MELIPSLLLSLLLNDNCLEQGFYFSVTCEVANINMPL